MTENIEVYKRMVEAINRIKRLKIYRNTYRITTARSHAIDLCIDKLRCNIPFAA
jgi:hypothetical protein